MKFRHSSVSKLQSLDIGQVPDVGVSDIRISGQSFIGENCNNSRTSHDAEIRLGPVTILDKRNTATSRKFDNDVMWATFASLSFFQFIDNLQISRNRFPWAGSIKLTFSLKITFHRTKCENRTELNL